MKCLSAAELGPRPKRADDWDTELSDSTAGDLLLVKDEGALLLAHRHARFMRRFEAARGEAARAYRQRSWSLRGLGHRRAGSCCAS